MAMTNYLSLASNYILEPKRNNLFTLELDYVPGQDNETKEKLKLDLETAQRPNISIGKHVLNRFNMKYKVGGIVDFSDSSLEVRFRDTYQLNLAKIFYDWVQLIHNFRTGAVGYSAAYKTDGYVYLLDPSEARVVEAWRYIGLFPTAVNTNEPGLEYGNGDVLKVSVTFSCDYYYLDVNKVDKKYNSKIDELSKGSYWSQNFAKDPYVAITGNNDGKDEYRVEIPNKQT